MSSEKFTQLPVVGSATLSDIICAVQGGVSSQETLAQVVALGISNTILNYPGNPNSNLAGTTYQLCWDTADLEMWVCTTSGNAAAAVWTPISDVGIITPTEGGTGVSNPTAHGIPVAEGASNFIFKTLSDGQVLIGSSGADPIGSTLTAGSNVTITNAAGSITINAVGASGITWTSVAGTSQAMTSNNGYIPTSGSLTTFTLPASSSVGDVLQLVGSGSGGWTIIYATGQQIIIGSSSSTVTTGNIASTNQFDSIYLVCTTANLTWNAAMGVQGNITLV